MTLEQQLAAVIRERDVAVRQLRLMCSENLKLYRRFHKPSARRVCGTCGHRHLSKKHERRCPDCPCAVRP